MEGADIFQREYERINREMYDLKLRGKRGANGPLR